MSKYSDATEVKVDEMIASNETKEVPIKEDPKVCLITREEIEEILTKNGFIKIETDCYRKTEEVVKQRMIVNGQEVSKKETIHIDVELIGEGYIEDSEKFLMTQGMSLKVSENAVSDFWVSSKEDLFHYLNLK